MKAVLMAFSPEECEKIFNGKITLDVCKIAPTLETPYKVYMYRTKEKGGSKIINDCLNSVYGGGKVVGEFVCDYKREFRADKYGRHSWTLIPIKEEPRFANANEMYRYVISRSVFYGLHITKPKRYDTPKALSEFRKPDVWYKTETGNTSTLVHETGTMITRPPQSFCYVEEIEE